VEIPPRGRVDAVPGHPIGLGAEIVQEQIVDESYGIHSRMAPQAFHQLTREHPSFFFGVTSARHDDLEEPCRILPESGPHPAGSVQTPEEEACRYQENHRDGYLAHDQHIPQRCAPTSAAPSTLVPKGGGHIRIGALDGRGQSEEDSGRKGNADAECQDGPVQGEI